MTIRRVPCEQYRTPLSGIRAVSFMTQRRIDAALIGARLPSSRPAHTPGIRATTPPPRGRGEAHPPDPGASGPVFAHGLGSTLTPTPVPGGFMGRQEPSRCRRPEGQRQIAENHVRGGERDARGRAGGRTPGRARDYPPQARARVEHPPTGAGHAPPIRPDMPPPKLRYLTRSPENACDSSHIGAAFRLHHSDTPASISKKSALSASSPSPSGTSANSARSCSTCSAECVTPAMARCMSPLTVMSIATGFLPWK